MLRGFNLVLGIHVMHLAASGTSAKLADVVIDKAAQVGGWAGPDSSNQKHPNMQQPQFVCFCAPATWPQNDMHASKFRPVSSPRPPAHSPLKRLDDRPGSRPPLETRG